MLIAIVAIAFVKVLQQHFKGECWSNLASLLFIDLQHRTILATFKNVRSTYCVTWDDLFCHITTYLGGLTCQKLRNSTDDFSRVLGKATGNNNLNSILISDRDSTRIAISLSCRI